MTTRCTTDDAVESSGLVTVLQLIRPPSWPKRRSQTSAPRSEHRGSGLIATPSSTTTSPLRGRESILIRLEQSLHKHQMQQRDAQYDKDGFVSPSLLSPLSASALQVFIATTTSSIRGCNHATDEESRMSVNSPIELIDILGMAVPSLSHSQSQLLTTNSLPPLTALPETNTSLGETPQHPFLSASPAPAAGEQAHGSGSPLAGTHKPTSVAATSSPNAVAPPLNDPAAADAAACGAVEADDVLDFLDGVIAGKTDELRQQFAQQTLDTIASKCRGSGKTADGDPGNPDADATVAPPVALHSLNDGSHGPGGLTTSQVGSPLSTKPSRSRYVSSAARSLQSYELVAYIGSGTFAEVTLARHKPTNELYAIKKISKQCVKEEGCVERTFTERQLLASLRHPFLVRLHQAFQSRTHLYLVLDLAQGGDLFYFAQEKLWVRDMKRTLRRLRYPYYISHNAVRDHYVRFTHGGDRELRTARGTNNSLASLPYATPRHPHNFDEGRGPSLHKCSLTPSSACSEQPPVDPMVDGERPLFGEETLSSPNDAQSLAPSSGDTAGGPIDGAPTSLLQPLPRSVAAADAAGGVVHGVPITIPAVVGPHDDDEQSRHEADADTALRADRNTSSTPLTGPLPGKPEVSIAEPSGGSTSAKATGTPSIAAVEPGDPLNHGSDYLEGSGSRRRLTQRPGEEPSRLPLSAQDEDDDDGGEVASSDGCAAAKASLDRHQSSLREARPPDEKHDEPALTPTGLDLPRATISHKSASPAPIAPLPMALTSSTTQRQRPHAGTCGTAQRRLGREEKAGHWSQAAGCRSTDIDSVQRRLSSSLLPTSLDEEPRKREDSPPDARVDTSNIHSLSRATLSGGEEEGNATATPACSTSVAPTSATQPCDSDTAPLPVTLATVTSTNPRTAAAVIDDDHRERPLRPKHTPGSFRHLPRKASILCTTLVRPTTHNSGSTAERVRTTDAKNSGRSAECTPRVLNQSLPSSSVRVNQSPLVATAALGSPAKQSSTASARVDVSADYVMHWMEDSTLELPPLAPDDSRFPLRLVAYYGMEVALVLHYLHGEGFIYRDLKPENILMKRNGDIMLTDFGVAKYRKGAVIGSAAVASDAAPADATPEDLGGRAMSFTGTAQYMSPEMLQGLPHDSRTDWWSFGCILFEWVNGRKAFDDSQSQFALFRSIVEEDVRVKDEDFMLTALELHLRTAQLHFRHQELRRYQEQQLGMLEREQQRRPSGAASLADTASSCRRPPSAPGNTTAPNGGSSTRRAAADDGGGGDENGWQAVPSLPSFAVEVTNASFQSQSSGTGHAGPAAHRRRVLYGDYLGPTTRDTFMQHAMDQMRDAFKLLQDLILSLLSRDVEKRLSGAAVFEHPFFRCPYVTSQLYFESTFARLRATETADDMNILMCVDDDDEKITFHRKCACGRWVDPIRVTIPPVAGGTASSREDAQPTCDLCTEPVATSSGPPSGRAAPCDALPRVKPLLVAAFTPEAFVSQMPPLPRPDSWIQDFLSGDIALYTPHLRTPDDLRYFPAAITATGFSAAAEQQKLIKEAKERSREQLRLAWQEAAMKQFQGTVAGDVGDRVGASGGRGPCSARGPGPRSGPRTATGKRRPANQSFDDAMSRQFMRALRSLEKGESPRAAGRMTTTSTGSSVGGGDSHDSGPRWRRAQRTAMFSQTSPTPPPSTASPTAGTTRNALQTDGDSSTTTTPRAHAGAAAPSYVTVEITSPLGDTLSTSRVAFTIPGESATVSSSQPRSPTESTLMCDTTTGDVLARTSKISKELLEAALAIASKPSVSGGHVDADRGSNAPGRHDGAEACPGAEADDDAAANLYYECDAEAEDDSTDDGASGGAEAAREHSSDTAGRSGPPDDPEKMPTDAVVAAAARDGGDDGREAHPDAVVGSATPPAVGPASLTQSPHGDRRPLVDDGTRGGHSPRHLHREQSQTPLSLSVTMPTVYTEAARLGVQASPPFVQPAVTDDDGYPVKRDHSVSHRQPSEASEEGTVTDELPDTDRPDDGARESEVGADTTRDTWASEHEEDADSDYTSSDPPFDYAGDCYSGCTSWSSSEDGSSSGSSTNSNSLFGMPLPLTSCVEAAGTVLRASFQDEALAAVGGVDLGHGAASNPANHCAQGGISRTSPVTTSINDGHPQDALRTVRSMQHLRGGARHEAQTALLAAAAGVTGDGPTNSTAATAGSSVYVRQNTLFGVAYDVGEEWGSRHASQPGTPSVRTTSQHHRSSPARTQSPRDRTNAKTAAAAVEGRGAAPGVVKTVVQKMMAGRPPGRPAQAQPSAGNTPVAPPLSQSQRPIWGTPHGAAAPPTAIAASSVGLTDQSSPQQALRRSAFTTVDTRKPPTEAVGVPLQSTTHVHHSHDLQDNWDDSYGTLPSPNQSDFFGFTLNDQSVLSTPTSTFSYFGSEPPPTSGGTTYTPGGGSPGQQTASMELPSFVEADHFHNFSFATAGPRRL